MTLPTIGMSSSALLEGVCDAFIGVGPTASMGHFQMIVWQTSQIVCRLRATQSWRAATICGPSQRRLRG
jgi:hypothetical protein